MQAIDRNIEQLRHKIKLNLKQCRQGTLALFARIPIVTNSDRQVFDRLFFQQSHPEFSPVGWHLGHIAYVESIWILQKCAGLKVLNSQQHQLYAANGIPKGDRVNLPTFAQTCAWLSEVRAQVWQYLATAPIQEQKRLWLWLIQHESYHSETIAFVLQMHYLQMGIVSSELEPADRSNFLETVNTSGLDALTGLSNGSKYDSRNPVISDIEGDRHNYKSAQYSQPIDIDKVDKQEYQLENNLAENRLIQPQSIDPSITHRQAQINNPNRSQQVNAQTEQSDYDAHSQMVQVAAGTFWQGSDAIAAFDNERSSHQVYVDTFWIDRYPITRKQFQVFMDAGGYQEKSWWSEAGWQWLQNLTKPIDRPFYWRTWQVSENHPVCGVSWYEADAYARFVGKRLPIESEWEKAAAWRSTNERSIREPAIRDHKSGQLGYKLVYPWDQKPESELMSGNDSFNAAEVTEITQILEIPEISKITEYCNCNSDRQSTTPIDAYPHSISPSGCYDMLGNVWEWTATRFYPYPGFTSFPYQGYSGAYFDRQHFVLKGGSWASRPWLLRSSTRNWYYACAREILAGFRCAHS